MVRLSRNTSGVAHMMWDINRDTHCKIETFMGSKIYTIDNVYKQPKTLARWLFSRKTAPVTNKDPFSLNGDHYDKRRMIYWADQASQLVWLASKLSQQTPNDYGALKTNVETWLRSEKNDYKNFYWWPHIDNGYNCIIFLNDNDDKLNGTNLYDPALKEEEWFKKSMDQPAHGSQPWVNKKKVKLVKYLEPKFNRMVLFDGAHFPHSPAVNDETYFCDSFTTEQWRGRRCNLCFFFHPE